MQKLIYAFLLCLILSSCAQTDDFGDLQGGKSTPPTTETQKQIDADAQAEKDKEQVEAYEAKQVEEYSYHG